MPCMLPELSRSRTLAEGLASTDETHSASASRGFTPQADCSEVEGVTRFFTG